MNHEDIANYADDNTPYVSGKNIDEVVRFLEEFSRVIFKWFSDNQFQANASICHVLLSTDEYMQIKIGTAQIENSSRKKLLGVTIEAKLSFEKNIEQIFEHMFKYLNIQVLATELYKKVNGLSP